MNPTASDTPLLPRVRLIPWRGPLHFGLLLATCGATLLLPLLYVAALVAGVVFLGWQGYLWTQNLAYAAALSWRDVLPLAYLSGGLVTWIFMLRPLLPNQRNLGVALQITPASQPAIFELVDELCYHLRLDAVEEVWLDTTATIRTSVSGGVMGIASGRLVLNIGLPVVSVTSAREFAALLVRELAMNAGGLGTALSFVVRELNAWFYRALHERDPWELDLRQARDKETNFQRNVRLTTWVWMWLAKLPFALFFFAARVISAAALLRLSAGADRAAVNLIGREAWASLENKLGLLDAAWAASKVEVRRGMTQQRLPDNLSLLLARHVARAARDLKAAPAASQRSDVPLGAAIVAHLPMDAPAASRLRGFVDLSRQVTFFYYQHELGLSLHEHRLVAEEEVLHQSRRDDDSLVIIRRYFGGLAHPERAMCGNGVTHAVSPGLIQLRDEILRGREEIKEWCSRMKMTLQEWNMAWQRRRDLEAAATLSLAGFSVSRVQFGTDDTSPQSLRNEAARQRMIMEHLESGLKEYEVRMEKRFAAALGLLWWSDESDLDEAMRERRKELPNWCSVYESMATALPHFRELLTCFFAFQTLGARFANLEDNGAFFTALQSVVPKMTNLVRQIIGSMDGAVYPFAENKKPIALNDYLLQGKLPEANSVSMNPGAAVDTKALSAQMAASASEVIAPFVDRFMQLYHQSYAWLAETAERTENFILSPMNLGIDIELLMPAEFARTRDTMPLKKVASPVH
ncbi:MAG: hypothetical protein ABL974_12020 [Prosthecobacter sp.]